MVGRHATQCAELGDSTVESGDLEDVDLRLVWLIKPGIGVPSAYLDIERDSPSIE
jgi:hypothetical protein